MTETESDKDTSNDVDMRILDEAPVVKGTPKIVALAPAAVNEREFYHNRDMLILTCMKGGGKKGKGLMEPTRTAGKRKPSKPLVV